MQRISAANCDPEHLRRPAGPAYRPDDCTWHFLQV